MPTQSDGTDTVRTSNTILKVIASLMLLPLLPLAVATNFLNTSDWLTPLPGIRPGGGIFSGFVTLLYVISIFSIFIVGGGFVTGNGAPVVNDPVPTTTPPPTEASTPSATSTGTAIPTSTPTPSESELREEYEHVRQEYLQKWPNEPNQYPTVPELLGTEVRMNQDALWVVFDETDVFENASRMRDEWTGVANAYLHALNNHSGPAPDRMVAVGWNNTGPITYFRVQTDDAHARLNRNISYNTFYNRFFRTVRATNDAERSIARDIAEHPPDDN